jgi:hypothetical protein
MSNSNHNGRDQRRELFHWKMKKLLLTLALYLLSAVPSWAQLAVVQNSGNSGDNMTSVTASPALTTTSGNLLVCDLAMYGTFSSFADSRTLTWTDSITLTSHSSDSGEKLGQKYVANASGGANHTFTLHLTAPGYPTVSCTEVSGAATSSVLDQTSINVSTVATTSQTSNSTSTTTQADEISWAWALRSLRHTPQRGVLLKIATSAAVLPHRESSAPVGSFLQPALMPLPTRPAAEIPGRSPLLRHSRLLPRLLRLDSSGDATDLRGQSEQENEGGNMKTETENKEQQGGEQPLRDQAWWERRAKHFESEYQREKAKRRELQKQFGEDED